MRPFCSALITTLTLVTGVAAWLFANHSLKSRDALSYTPNPLGIKQSPYGEVIAMSLQGSLDVDWHAMEGGHEHGEHCEECEKHEAEKKAEEQYRSPLGNLIAHAQEAVTERTNPNPPNAFLKYYLRRAMGNKLRFAYELDPAHYTNYNIYNLFLTINELNTRHASEQDVFRLSNATIAYCMAYESDPRPALTAASAAANALEITMRPGSTYPRPVTQYYFATLQAAINRYEKLLSAWQADGTWNSLSEIRREECTERHHYNCKVRDDVAAFLNRQTSPAAPLPSSADH